MKRLEAAVDSIEIAIQVQRIVRDLPPETSLTALTLASGTVLAAAAKKYGADLQVGIDVHSARIGDCARKIAAGDLPAIDDWISGLNPAPRQRQPIAGIEHLSHLVTLLEAIDQTLREKTANGGLDPEVDAFMAMTVAVGVLAATDKRGVEHAMFLAEETVTSTAALCEKGGVKSLSDFIAMTKIGRTERDKREHAASNREEADTIVRPIDGDRSVRSEALSDMLRRLRVSGVDVEAMDIDYQSESGGAIHGALSALLKGGDGSDCPIQAGDYAEFIADAPTIEKWKAIAAASPTMSGLKFPEPGQVFSVYAAERVPPIYQGTSERAGLGPFAIGIEIDGKKRKFPADWFKKVEKPAGLDVNVDIRASA